MKTLRLTLLALVVAASSTAALAGPSTQFWQQRRAQAPTQPVATAAEKPAAKCETMIVKDGKRTSTVSCTGETAKTAKCKAMCGS